MSSLRVDFEKEGISIRIDCDVKIQKKKGFIDFIYEFYNLQGGSVGRGGGGLDQKCENSKIWGGLDQKCENSKFFLKRMDFTPNGLRFKDFCNLQGSMGGVSLDQKREI